MKPETIKILIADDHHLIRDGIKAMLSHIKDFEVLGEAKNGKEAIEKVDELSPDVVIMDVSMPDLSGIEATEIIKNKHPDTKILVLTQHENDEYIYQVLQSGGSGYLLKNTNREHFINAIRKVAKGENYFSKKVSDLIMQQYLNKDRNDKHAKQGEQNDVRLTNREKEIIKLIVEEFSNHDIANHLFISLRTVETHRRNIMHKLKINNVIALMKYAVKTGLFLLDK